LKAGRKKRVADLDRVLAIAVKTGKVLFGADSALSSALTGKVRLIIVASNSQKKLREKLEYYCNLSKVPFMVYPRTSLEVGRGCGIPFDVSALAIKDLGDSDILKIVVKKSV
jgi:large subunit ribosomal protein L30e